MLARSASLQMKLSPPAREAAALLRALDVSVQSDTAQSCRLGLKCLCEMDEKGLTYALGANAVNRVMSLCAEDAERAETLYRERLEKRGLVDASSLQILASGRLARGALPEAAAATEELLFHVEREQTCKAKVAAQCRCVLDACQRAGITDHAVSSAEARWHRLQSLGIIPIRKSDEAPPLVVERTLALLKPDAVRAGHEAAIVSLVRTHGFSLVATRRWHMGERDAVDFLSASWGNAAGDRRRKFFRSMVDFYCSGECVALLLQREDAIAEWRRLLGVRGDPAICRQSAPESVRARFGTNKQANAAHGADSTAAATREIDHVFGHGWSEPDWAPLVFPTSASLRRAHQELRRCDIRVTGELLGPDPRLERSAR